MTYILGARCTNGVVLIGDLKRTDKNTGIADYNRKIFQFGSTVLGMSGISRYAEKINEEVQRLFQENLLPQIVRPLILGVHEQLRSIHVEEAKQFQALIAERIGDKSKLYYAGYQEFIPISSFMPTGNTAVASYMVLNRLINPNLEMRDIAKIGYFTIKCLEKIDAYVGLNDRHPQIYFLPDNPQPKGSTYQEPLDIREATNIELDEMKKDVDKMLEKFDNFIKGLLA
mgnify:CR=1 FL=1